MFVAWLLLIASLLVILVGCEIFTNSVEWIGKKLHLGEGAVGSILAAVGTCLPESLIAILAIVFGKKSGQGDDVGIGAILGAPLMLSTLAFFVSGSAVLFYTWRKRRTTHMSVSTRVLTRDLRYFFIVFSLSAMASLLPGRPIRYTVAFGLVALYALYVRQTLQDTRHPDSEEDLSPLHFLKKHHDPPLGMVLLQAGVGLGVLVFGAHLFVGELQTISASLGISVLVLSLIVTPIATELPEKFNSVLWIRQKKDTLALGNISGAMVFQSSIPPAIGMLFTKWQLNPQAMTAVVVAIIASATVWGQLMWKRRLSPWPLLMGGVFYIVYLVTVFRI